jgi:chromate transporter
VLGSCAALIGLISGPFFFVIGLASGYGLLKTYPFIEPAMEGIAASAIGLVLIVAIRGTRVAASQPIAMIAMLATFVGVGIMQWSLPIVAAVVGTLSVIAAWVRQNR